MFKSYLKTALRGLRHNKANALISILGLAMGLVVSLYIGLWVKEEFSFDRFHQNAHDIYRLSMRMDGKLEHSLPLPVAPRIRGRYPEIVKATRYTQVSNGLKFGDLQFYEEGALVDRAFFDLFTFPLLDGSVDDGFENSQTLYLSQRLARKYFKDVNPVGQSLMVNGEKAFLVAGVFKDVPRNSHLQFDFLMPMLSQKPWADRSWNLDCQIYIQTHPGADATGLASQIGGFIEQNDPMESKITVGLQPLSQIHLHALEGTDPIVYIYIFMGLGLIILLIACINVINLSISQANTRIKEIGLRKVVGARRRNLIAQFLGESILGALLGLVLASITALLLFPQLNHLAGESLSLKAFLSPSTLLGAVGLAVMIGAASGLYPALLLASFPPVTAVKGKFQSNRNGRVLKRFFVSGQFVTTLVMLLVTMALYKQLNFIRHMDLGMNTDQVMVVPMEQSLWEHYDTLKEELMRSPDILLVSSGYNDPLNIYHMNMADWQGNPTGSRVSVNDQSVDEDYFELFGMEFVAGRPFDAAAPSDETAYILNEAAVRLTGYDDPLGKPFTAWSTEGPIIGVVKDFHSTSIHQSVRPIVFMRSVRHGYRTKLFIKVEPHRVSEAMTQVKTIAARFAPNHPIEFTFLDDIFAKQYANDRRMGALYRLFTILAVAISCMGLYGLVSSTVEGKIKEVGIRKVLGASVPGVMITLSREFVALIALAGLIASPIAYLAIQRVLGSYAYKAPVGMGLFLGAWLLLLTVALATLAGKVTRAAQANPVKSLRQQG